MLTNPPVTYDLQSYIYLLWANPHLAQCLNSVLNMKVIAAFNQVKALEGSISVIMQLQTSQSCV